MAAATGTMTTNTARKSSIKSRIKSKNNAMSNQRYGAYVVLVVVLTVIVGMIAIRSVEASLQHSNNLLTKDNEYLQAEIDALNSEIINETKLSNIEKTAVSELGMITPTSENCITIEDEKSANSNLAATIIDEAYN